MLAPGCRLLQRGRGKISLCPLDRLGCVEIDDGYLSSGDQTKSAARELAQPGGEKLVAGRSILKALPRNERFLVGTDRKNAVPMID